MTRTYPTGKDKIKFFSRRKDSNSNTSPIIRNQEVNMDILEQKVNADRKNSQHSRCLTPWYNTTNTVYNRLNRHVYSNECTDSRVSSCDHKCSKTTFGELVMFCSVFLSFVFHQLV